LNLNLKFITPLAAFGGCKSADSRALQIRGLFSENDLFYCRAAAEQV
jgi:hypothetical protein